MYKQDNMYEPNSMDKVKTRDVLVQAIHKLVTTQESVSEIETNSPGLLFYKQKGERKSMSIPLANEEEYSEAIDGLIEDAGFINKAYLVEGRYNLPNEQFGRLHIVLPPASPMPLLTLAIKSLSLTDLTAIQGSGTFDTNMSIFLKAAIGSKLTIVISGGTGAGKTTLLEAMTGEFNEDERVAICEDSPELMLKTQNTAYMESTVWSPGLDPNDVAPLSWVVQQANRMRVDRIIVGETRGAEFYDFIVAANSGAEGSLTTLHANDGDAAMKKMTSFMFTAIANMTAKIANDMLSSTVDIIIQLGKSRKTGGHRVLSIHEVTNMVSTGESPTVALNPLFMYSQDDDAWTSKYATDNLKAVFKEKGYDSNTYKPFEVEEEFEISGGLPSYFIKETD